MAIIAWHGEQQLKDKALERLREHRRLDRIAQGLYWERGRGCLLGCLTHSNDHAHESAQRLFGIELRIGYWLEMLFEGLPEKECEWWVIASAEAIPAGADLSLCHHHLCLWLLRDSGLLTIRDEIRKAFEAIALLHQNAINGGFDDRKTWRIAEDAVMRSVNKFSRTAPDELSEESAAYSASLNFRSTADAASFAAHASAHASVPRSLNSETLRDRQWLEHKRAAYKQIAEKSLEIFAAAPVTTERTECGECVQQAYAVLATDKISEFVTP